MNNCHQLAALRKFAEKVNSFYFFAAKNYDFMLMKMRLYNVPAGGAGWSDLMLYQMGVEKTLGRIGYFR